MSDKISVIMPVYNAEKTLAMTLGNLLHQTYGNMEFVLVNDCSTDNSLMILESAERQFPDKVMVIDLDANSGPGGARNVGLMYATGDYLGFVDADDIVDVTMYEKLYGEAVKGNYDIVECGFFEEKKGESFIRLDEENVGDLNDRSKAMLIANGGFLVNKIYKRELFEGIVFRGNHILEDLETHDAVLLRAKRMGMIKEVLYKYCYYPNSASRLVEPLRYHRDTIDALVALDEVEKNYELSLDGGRNDAPEVRMAAEYVMLQLAANALTMLYKVENRIDSDIWKNEYNEIKTIMKERISPEAMTNPYSAKRLGEIEKKVLKKFCKEVK